MGTDRSWETASAVLVNVAYTLAVVVMVVMAVPALRTGASALAGRQVLAWRYGRWLAGRTAAPRWTSLLARDDLPADNPRRGPS